MAPFHLIASSDDFLLEEQVREITRTASEALAGVEAEVLPSDITPEDLATLLCSPSLFAPQRLLVVPEAGDWFVAPPSRSAPKSAREGTVDAAPVVRVLEEGLSDDIVLVMGACCSRKPRGPLVTAADAAGSFTWLPAPEAPKPWDDVEVSKEQEQVLRTVLARVVGDVRFTDGATRLLMDRLGYAPRLLIQEAKKLAAAEVNHTVNEELVRALCFPKERSIEVVRDAVFEKRAAPILDLLVAGEAGIQVRDWRGQALNSDSLPIVIASQVGALLQQMLYLRRMVVRMGMEAEMAPERTAEPKWYPYRFKSAAGPALMEALEADAPSPIIRPGRKPPSLFIVGQLFKGAGAYTDAELVDAIAGFGRMEADLRGDMATEALSFWLSSALGVEAPD